MLEAVTVDVDRDESEALQAEWDARDIPVPLKRLASPYREITRPIVQYVRDIRRQSPRDVVMVYIPEYVVGHWWEHILHNQSALFLKGRHTRKDGSVGSFHLQITAAGLGRLGTDSEAELFKKIPDIDLFHTFKAADEKTIVVTIRGIGETERLNPKSFVRLDPEPPPYDDEMRELILDRVMEAVDAQLPPLVFGLGGTPEYGLVVGFDQEGPTFFARTFFDKGDDPRRVGWDAFESEDRGGLVFLDKGAAPDRANAVREGIDAGLMAGDASDRALASWSGAPPAPAQSGAQRRHFDPGGRRESSRGARQRHDRHNLDHE